jgi:hypothetical protein
MLTCAPYCDFPDGHWTSEHCTLVMWTGPQKCFRVGMRGFTHVSYL